MRRNMGTADRVVRALVALGIVALYLSGTISGIWAVVLGIVAVAFAVTSAAGSCPAYLPFGFSTRGGGTQGE
jgi:1,4-dihydroxy-2-naphthoate octaprenyltransferase